jgi:hypothetical protein
MLAITSRAFVLALSLLCTFPLALCGEEYQNGFEESEKSCRVQFDQQKVQLKLHERTQGLAYAGQSAERIQFLATEHDTTIQIECPIPPARILDELQLSLAVYSNRPGLQLHARVVFPKQTDPQTGKPLTRLIKGDVLTKENSWQRLKCRTTDGEVAKHLILWRASLKPTELDARGMYIDRVVLQQTLGRGMTEILLDDLRLAPVVEPEQGSIIPIEEFEQRPRAPRIDFQLDHLRVGGRPFFPIMVPYQREPVELFTQLGTNVVWVDNLNNRDLINSLNERGIWTTAWPPSAKSRKGDLLDGRQANLVPFGAESEGILFWNLGVRIEPEMHKPLQDWVHQIKSSDREFNRPILADVTGGETIFSRDVEILGVSKHVLQSPYGMRDYANHLMNRKLLAQPGTFVITWIQTEPSRAVNQYREAAQLGPAVIEPEQIRLQTYTALTTGCKGLGFWNWTPLNATGAGFEERRLVIEQLCQELELLEPFLANGEVIHRFEVPMRSALQERARGASRNEGKTGKLLPSTAPANSKSSSPQSQPDKPSPQSPTVRGQSPEPAGPVRPFTSTSSPRSPGELPAQRVARTDPLTPGGPQPEPAAPPASSSSAGKTKTSARDQERGELSNAPPSLAATAAVLRSEHGLVILLSALEDNAQFVPGPMGQSDLRLMIRGLPESAFLWEITPTGLWPLETHRVTGGTEIRLPRFNMTAALMVATDQGVAQEMERKIQKIQRRSAELALQLAEAKTTRVVEIDQELASLGVGLGDATHLLEQSRRTLAAARDAYAKQQFHQARLNANLASQLLRILQRMHWQQAVRHVSAPTSVPHTLCFQTLPDYWRLIQQLARAEIVNPQALKSGGFEDPDAMLVEGWTKDVTTSKEVVVYDALDPQVAHKGNFCLRMASVPANPQYPMAPQEPVVSYRSPAIEVKPGDVAHITGWVRIPRPITSGLEGFRIYDSHYGVASALKWDQPSSWQQFEMLRPIWKQESLQLFLELHGFGDVAIDDLQVKIVRLKSAQAAPLAEAADNDEETAKPRGSALDFLNRFLK